MTAGSASSFVTPVFIPITFVVAVADNGVIGNAGRLPWRIKSEMQHFRAATMGRPVVMGRKTFASIGKPLAGRTNIVVSRDAGFAVPGVVVAPSVEAALDVARGDALRRGADAIAVIGGADIFAQCMERADRLDISYVHLSPPGDTKFPPIDLRLWREIKREPHPQGPGDDAPFTVIVYERRSLQRGSAD